MKNQRLIKQGLIIAAIASLFTIGCKKSEKSNPTPIITAISPLTGLLGSSVTITGSNFNTDLNKDTVRFNGVMANICSASATSIVVTVPANATTGKISLFTNGKTMIYPTDFNVMLPVPTLSDVTVINLISVSQIIIIGNGFNPDGAKNTVTLGSITASVVSASSTLLIAQVSSKAAGQVSVTSYGTTLTYPNILNISPYTYTSIHIPTMGYLAADASGNVYGESGNAVVKLLPSGATNTLATIGASATVLQGTAVDAAGTVYATGHSDHKIYKISPAGAVSTFAGSGVSSYADGQGVTAQFISPTSLTIDASGNLFVCDSNRVRKITREGLVSTFAGSATPGDADGQGTLASFNSLVAITSDQAGNLFVINSAGTIRKITSGGLVSTLNLLGPLVGVSGFNKFVFAHGITGCTQIAAAPSGNLFVCNSVGITFGTQNANAGLTFPIYLINQSGYVAQFSTETFVRYPGITSDSAGNIYVSNQSFAYDGSFMIKYSFLK